jgi:hypothetical protein
MDQTAKSEEKLKLWIKNYLWSIPLFFKSSLIRNPDQGEAGTIWD